MRALVTGLNGFAGRYLQRELESNGYEVHGLVDKSAQRIDVRDRDAVYAVLRTIRPDAVFHLAAQAVAARSWSEPQETMEVNVVGTCNLLEAIRQSVPWAHVLLVGSADQYGMLLGDGEAISETTSLCPQTPYAVSKCASEQLGAVYAHAYNMNVCMTRTFSYGGAGQPRGFVLSDFAYGIAAVEKGVVDSLKVGNLNSERDFTHIKDVVRAYRMLCEKGVPGETYNVGSGELRGIRETLQGMLKLSKHDIHVVQPPSKIRPVDVRGASCDHSKLTRITGWQPTITYAAMLKEELEDFRYRLEEEMSMQKNEKIFTGGGGGWQAMQ